MAKTKIKRNSTIYTIQEAVREQMKNLGVYSPEYEVVIRVFSDTIRQYNLALTQFEKEGMVYEVETSSGGSKKSGTVSALETLRKDIGTYSDRLMLNPKAFKDVVGNQDSGSKLDKIMESFGVG